MCMHSISDNGNGNVYSANHFIRIGFSADMHIAYMYNVYMYGYIFMDIKKLYCTKENYIFLLDPLRR